MKPFYKLSCWLYDRVLSLYNDDLLLQHGEEMRYLFRQQLADALRDDPAHVLTLWRNIATDTFTLVGPTYLARLRLVSVSTLAASALVLSFFLSFTSLGKIHVVHAYADAAPLSLAAPDQPAASPHQRP